MKKKRTQPIIQALSYIKNSLNKRKKREKQRTRREKQSRINKFEAICRLKSLSIRRCYTINHRKNYKWQQKCNIPKTNK